MFGVCLSNLRIPLPRLRLPLDASHCNRMKLTLNFLVVRQVQSSYHTRSREFLRVHSASRRRWGPWRRRTGSTWASSGGCRGTPPARRPRSRGRSHRSPKRDKCVGSFSNTRVIISFAFRTPQYLSPLKICGGRTFLCPSFFFPFDLMISFCLSIPGAAMSTGSNSIDRLFRIMKMRCWCVTIWKCMKNVRNACETFPFLHPTLPSARLALCWTELSRVKSQGPLDRAAS